MLMGSDARLLRVLVPLVRAYLPTFGRPDVAVALAEWEREARESNGDPVRQVQALQNKVMRQGIALTALQHARGDVSVVKDQFVQGEGYVPHTIGWAGHEWVRRDFYDEQVRQRNGMAQRLSQAYGQLEKLRR
jgi:hypothetical protein